MVTADNSIPSLLREWHSQRCRDKMQLNNNYEESDKILIIISDACGIQFIDLQSSTKLPCNKVLSVLSIISNEIHKSPITVSRKILEQAHFNKSMCQLQTRKRVHLIDLYSVTATAPGSEYPHATCCQYAVQHQYAINSSNPHAPATLIITASPSASGGPSLNMMPPWSIRTKAICDFRNCKAQTVIPITVKINYIIHKCCQNFSFISVRTFPQKVANLSVIKC